METGLQITCMVEVNTSGQMAESTKGITLRIKDMVKESSFGKMEDIMKVSGKKERCMGRGRLPIKMVKRRMGFGLKAKELCF